MNKIGKQEVRSLLSWNLHSSRMRQAISNLRKRNIYNAICSKSYGGNKLENRNA